MKSFLLPVLAALVVVANLRGEVDVFLGQPTVAGREYLLAGWNFNGDSGESSDPLAVSHGHSLLNTNWEPDDLADFSGASENLFATDAAGRDLGLRNGADLINEGRFLEFSLSLDDFENLEVSYATRRSGTGFTDQEWSWSVDGENFVPFAMVRATESYEAQVLDFSEVAELDGAELVVLRLTVAGLPESPSAAGNNRFDNFQFRATAIRGSAGPGTASLSNATEGSALEGTGVFEPGASAALAVSIAGMESAVIESVRIHLPEAWPGASVGSVELSGEGLSGASAEISGGSVLISGAEVGVSGATVFLRGVPMPSAEAVSDYGNFSVSVETARAGEALAWIGNSPVGMLVMSIAGIREVDEAGVAEALNRRVAVSGIATVDPGLFHNERFVVYLQDETAGVAIYHPSLWEMSVGSTAGKRFVAVGEVIQFHGLTQIAIGGEDDFIRMGSEALPEPQVCTLAEVWAEPERLEGGLIRIPRVFKVDGEGGWPEPGATGTMTVADENGQHRIEVLMHRFTDISWADEPQYPMDLVGVLSQSDASEPFAEGYQLLPRSGDDFLPASERRSGFEAWREEHFVGQLENLTVSAAGVDPDGDGLVNLLEYAFGGDPHAGSHLLLPEVELEGDRLAIRFRRMKAAVDVSYSVEASSDLEDWTSIWSSAVVPYRAAEDVSEELVSDVESVASQARRFLRLRVERVAGF